MVEDTQASLLTYLYNLITTDGTLESTMGGTVRLYPVWAMPDAEFPYLVNRIVMQREEPFPQRSGTYYIDIWSNSSDISEAVSVRRRLIELLDELQFNTEDVKNIRLSLQTDGFVPEPEPDIWHYTLQFNISLWRLSETISIIGR
jgi:hypothetical protein